MPKFFIPWKVDPAKIPLAPEERAKLWLAMLEMVKADLQAGVMKDWGMRSGELSGYGITSELSEVEVHSFLLKWIPYVIFEVNPVLTVDQSIEVIKKAVAAAQAK